MLAEIEQRFNEESRSEPQNQLELFGALLSDFVEARRDDGVAHEVLTREGHAVSGTWEDIVCKMRDANTAFAGRSMQDFMVTEARRGFSLTGITIPTHDAESFIRGSADAGLLRIVR